MKSLAAIIVFLFLLTSNSFGQLSLALGYSLPLGEYEDRYYGAANQGWQFVFMWDESFEARYGLSTGVIVEYNETKEIPSIYQRGSWTSLIFEAGLFTNPVPNLKLKSLIAVGLYSTPRIRRDFVTFALQKTRIALDFRAEYNISKILVGANILYSPAQFELSNGTSFNIPNHAISSVGLIVGFNF